MTKYWYKLPKKVRHFTELYPHLVCFSQQNIHKYIHTKFIENDEPIIDPIPAHFVVFDGLDDVCFPFFVVSKKKNSDGDHILGIIIPNVSKIHDSGKTGFGTDHVQFKILGDLLTNDVYKRIIQERKERDSRVEMTDQEFEKGQMNYQEHSLFLNEKRDEIKFLLEHEIEYYRIVYINFSALKKAKMYYFLGSLGGHNVNFDSINLGFIDTLLKYSTDYFNFY